MSSASGHRFIFDITQHDGRSCAHTFPFYLAVMSHSEAIRCSEESTSSSVFHEIVNPVREHSANKKRPRCWVCIQMFSGPGDVLKPTTWEVFPYKIKTVSVLLILKGIVVKQTASFIAIILWRRLIKKFKVHAGQVVGFWFTFHTLVPLRCSWIWTVELLLLGFNPPSSGELGAERQGQQQEGRQTVAQQRFIGDTLSMNFLQNTSLNHCHFLVICYKTMT